MPLGAPVAAASPAPVANVPAPAGAPSGATTSAGIYHGLLGGAAATLHSAEAATGLATTAGEPTSGIFGAAAGTEDDAPEPTEPGTANPSVGKWAPRRRRGLFEEGEDDSLDAEMASGHAGGSSEDAPGGRVFGDSAAAELDQFASGLLGAMSNPLQFRELEHVDALAAVSSSSDALFGDDNSELFSTAGAADGGPAAFAAAADATAGPDDEVRKPALGALTGSDLLFAVSVQPPAGQDKAGARSAACEAAAAKLAAGLISEAEYREILDADASATDGASGTESLSPADAAHLIASGAIQCYQEISVTSFSAVQGGATTFVVYTIRATARVRPTTGSGSTLDLLDPAKPVSWSIRRRFSEFCGLLRVLKNDAAIATELRRRKELGPGHRADFPSKIGVRASGATIGPARRRQLEARRVALDKYMKCVCFCAAEAQAQDQDEMQGPSGTAIVLRSDTMRCLDDFLSPQRQAACAWHFHGPLPDASASSSPTEGGTVTLDAAQALRARHHGYVRAVPTLQRHRQDQAESVEADDSYDWLFSAAATDDSSEAHTVTEPHPLQSPTREASGPSAGVAPPAQAQAQEPLQAQTKQRSAGAQELDMSTDWMQQGIGGGRHAMADLGLACQGELTNRATFCQCDLFSPSACITIAVHTHSLGVTLKKPPHCPWLPAVIYKVNAFAFAASACWHFCHCAPHPPPPPPPGSSDSSINSTRPTVQAMVSSKGARDCTLATRCTESMEHPSCRALSTCASSGSSVPCKRNQFALRSSVVSIRTIRAKVTEGTFAYDVVPCARMVPLRMGVAATVTKQLLLGLDDGRSVWHFRCPHCLLPT